MTPLWARQACHQVWGGMTGVRDSGEGFYMQNPPPALNCSQCWETLCCEEWKGRKAGSCFLSLIQELLARVALERPPRLHSSPRSAPAPLAGYRWPQPEALGTGPSRPCSKAVPSPQAEGCRLCGGLPVVGVVMHSPPGGSSTWAFRASSLEGGV